MAPCASRPQPSNAVCSSGRTVDQTSGQESVRGKRLSADVEEARTRSDDANAEAYILTLMQARIM